MFRSVGPDANIWMCLGHLRADVFNPVPGVNV